MGSRIGLYVQTPHRIKSLIKECYGSLRKLNSVKSDNQNIAVLYNRGVTKCTSINDWQIYKMAGSNLLEG